MDGWTDGRMDMTPIGALRNYVSAPYNKKTLNRGQ